MTDPRRTIVLDPRLDAVARYVLAIGALLVLLLPAARGFNEQLGWLPMWLLAMPAAAWWGAHGFALPRRRGEGEADGGRARSRRSGAQARRRGRAGLKAAWLRAA
jgi:hypothetical protein